MRAIWPNKVLDPVSFRVRVKGTPLPGEARELAISEALAERQPGGREYRAALLDELARCYMRAFLDEYLKDHPQG